MCLISTRPSRSASSSAVAPCRSLLSFIAEHTKRQQSMSYLLSWFMFPAAGRTFKPPLTSPALAAAVVPITSDGTKSEFLLQRYLVKNNLLAPVFALFRENRGRDNLINSAVIELVEVRGRFVIFFCCTAVTLQRESTVERDE